MKILNCLLTLALLVSLTSCGSSKKKVQVDDQDPNVSVGSEGLENVEVNGDSDSGKAGALQTVYFSYNSYSLAGDAKAALSANAEYLKANPSIEIQIEGHADERGGVQFNLALGEQRAKSAKDYLVALGVAANRIATMTFGKERPISFGHDEGSWSKNRRANFVVTAK